MIHWLFLINIIIILIEPQPSISTDYCITGISDKVPNFFCNICIFVVAVDKKQFYLDVNESNFLPSFELSFSSPVFFWFHQTCSIWLCVSRMCFFFLSNIYLKMYNFSNFSLTQIEENGKIVIIVSILHIHDKILYSIEIKRD